MEKSLQKATGLHESAGTRDFEEFIKEEVESNFTTLELHSKIGTATQKQLMVFPMRSC